VPVFVCDHSFGCSRCLATSSYGSKAQRSGAYLPFFFVGLERGPFDLFSEDYKVGRLVVD